MIDETSMGVLELHYTISHDRSTPLDFLKFKIIHVMSDVQEKLLGFSI